MVSRIAAGAAGLLFVLAAGMKLASPMEAAGAVIHAAGLTGPSAPFQAMALTAILVVLEACIGVWPFADPGRTCRWIAASVLAGFAGVRLFRFAQPGRLPAPASGD